MPARTHTQPAGQGAGKEAIHSKPELIPFHYIYGP